MTSELDQSYWDGRWQQVYRTRQAIADSREPNPQLRAEVNALPPAGRWTPAAATDPMRSGSPRRAGE